MTQNHRYSGPELSRLLDQVRDELGIEATILEANKVRTGGVAGFFAKENFEVVAARPEATRPIVAAPTNHAPAGRAPTNTAPTNTASTNTAPTNTAPTNTAPTNTASTSMVPTNRVSAATNGQAGPSHGVSTALLDRADAISVQERIELSRNVGRDETVLDLDVSRRSFDAVLADELRQVLTEEVRQPEVSVTPRPTDDFWSRLDSCERNLAVANDARPLIAIVGNTHAALSVAQMLNRSSADQERAMLLVSLEDEVDVLPFWQMAQNVGQLVERLRSWSDSEWPGTVVIDAEMGPRVVEFVQRVRMEHPGQIRLAVDDEYSARKIFDVMRTLGGEIVVDITFRARSSYLMDLIRCDIPVVTVGGRLLDAGLLLAIAADAARG